MNDTRSHSSAAPRTIHLAYGAALQKPISKRVLGRGITAFEQCKVCGTAGSIKNRDESPIMSGNISREQKLEIIRLYRTGIHGNALAKQFGYPNSSVYKWLIDADVIEQSVPKVPVRSFSLVEQALINSPVSVWALGSRA